jgi:hypothetical protein
VLHKIDIQQIANSVRALRMLLRREGSADRECRQAGK